MSTMIEFSESSLTDEEQSIVTDGLEQQSSLSMAPEYVSSTVAWKQYSDERQLVAVLTGKQLWDWLYVDELFVIESQRGNGLGKTLLIEAERYANKQSLTGIWLWTQSWQAEDFYKRLGYHEFCRFPDFPKGFQRIGLRKQLQG